MTSHRINNLALASLRIMSNMKQSNMCITSGLQEDGMQLPIVMEVNNLEKLYK